MRVRATSWMATRLPGRLAMVALKELQPVEPDSAVASRVSVGRLALAGEMPRPLSNTHDWPVAWASACEKLMDVQVPKRAQYLRVISCELNRIASHMIAVGAMAMDIGATTPFMWALREREYINDFIEELCGARLTYNYHRIGGVSFDMPKGWRDKVKTWVDKFVPLMSERYFLLVRRDALDSPMIERLLTVMRSREFKAHLVRLQGLDSGRCGKIEELADAFPSLAPRRRKARTR